MPPELFAGLGDLMFDFWGYLFCLLSCACQATYLLLVEFKVWSCPWHSSILLFSWALDFCYSLSSAKWMIASKQAGFWQTAILYYIASRKQRRLTAGHEHIYAYACAHTYAHMQEGLQLAASICPRASGTGPWRSFIFRVALLQQHFVAADARNVGVGHWGGLRSAQRVCYGECWHTSAVLM